MMAENKVVLALGMEISELEKTTGSLVRSLQEVKACALETGRGLEKAQESIVVSKSHRKTLTDKVSSLTEELKSLRVERA